MYKALKKLRGSLLIAGIGALLIYASYILSGSSNTQDLVGAGAIGMCGVLALIASFIEAIWALTVNIQPSDFFRFTREWKNTYRANVEELSLFSSSLVWTPARRERFVRLFYHARGHFADLLWQLAGQATPEERRVIVTNIMDELGGFAGSAHEILYFRFAQALGIDIREDEAAYGRSYESFLADYNHGHVAFILSHDHIANWALFSAYELLDNVDYTKLLELAKGTGVTGSDSLQFFSVHVGSSHYSQTYTLLHSCWNKDERAVREAFEFIASHQLAMWRQLGEEVEKVM